MAIKLGASGQIVRRTTNLPSSTVWSVAAWVKVNSVRSSQYQYFIGSESGTSNAAEYAVVGYSQAGTFEIGAYSNGGQSVALRAPVVGTWEFYAITNAGAGLNNLKVYQKRLGEATLFSTTLNGVGFIPAIFGFGNDSYDEWCNVEVGEGFVFNRALTEAEVLTIASCGAFPYNGINSHATFFNHTKIFDTVNPGVSWEIVGSGLTTTFFSPPYTKTFSVDVRLEQVSGAVSFSLTSVNAQAASVGSVSLSQSHQLTVTSVVSGQSTVDVVVITTINNLIAVSPSTGPPTIGNVSLATVHALVLQNVATQSPTVELTTISTTNGLSLQNVDSGQGIVSGCSISQTNNLSLSQIVTSQPVTGSLVLGSGSELVFSEIAGSPLLVGGISLGQTHSLTNQEILSGLSSVVDLELSQTHNFLFGQIESVVVVGQLDLEAANTLLLSGIASNIVVSNCSLGQIHVLNENEIVSGTSTIGQLTISQDFVLGLEAVEIENPVVDSTTISTIYAVELVNILSTGLIEQNSLSQVHIFLPSILVINAPVIGEVGINLGDLPITKRTKVVSGVTRIKTVASTQPKVKTVYSVDRLRIIK